jgi:5-methylcytosine-specific restriction endonuclease McrBC regulatory subunit McrC
VNPARIERLPCEGKHFTTITIDEVGQFLVPRGVLADQAIYPSALEVLQIAVGTTADEVIFEAKTNVATVEMLSKDIRLQINPKIANDAFRQLLEWAALDPFTSTSRRAPLASQPSESVARLLAKRFIDECTMLTQLGAIQTVDTRSIVSSGCEGELQVASSCERIFGQGDVRFDQTVNHTHFNAPANRVLKTALHLALPLLTDVDASEGEQIDDLQHILSRTEAYNRPEALAACSILVEQRSLDPSRSYYYPGLIAALPLLESSEQVGDGLNIHLHRALRYNTAMVFEAGVRNFLRSRLAKTHVVSKEQTHKLYRSTSSSRFNQVLEPDVVLRNLRDLTSCDAVVDIKYKGEPTASDHYQLSCYVQSHRAKFGCFVSIGSPLKEQPAEFGHTHSGEVIYEFCVDESNTAQSVNAFADWIAGRMTLSDAH